MSADRTVHARMGHTEIVRYDRTGKWFQELAGLPRLHIGVGDAARVAVLFSAMGGEIFAGRAGGRVFDKRVADLQEKRA